MRADRTACAPSMETSQKVGTVFSAEKIRAFLPILQRLKVQNFKNQKHAFSPIYWEFPHAFAAVHSVGTAEFGVNIRPLNAHACAFCELLFF